MVRSVTRESATFSEKRRSLCILPQAQTDNDDTLALLECLGEGAAAEEGGPLRESYAKGIMEFLRYAIKQSSETQQARGAGVMWCGAV